MKLLATLCLFIFVASPLSAREWIDNTGKFRVEAEFVELVGQKVHLRKPDGKVIAVVIARLNVQGRQAVATAAQAALVPATKTVPAVPKPSVVEPTPPQSKSVTNQKNSQALAKALANQQNALLARVNDRLAQASVVWNETRKLFDHQSAAIPKSNASVRPQTLSIGPAEAIQTVVAGLVAHRPRVFWDALPRGYQHDLHALLHQHAANIDPQLWQAARQLWQKSLLVLRNQQQFLVRYPLISEALAETSAATSSANAPLASATSSLASDKIAPKSLAAYEAMLTVLTTLAESDLADLPKLRTLEIGSLLDQTGVDLMQQLAAVSQLTGDDSFNQALSLVSGMQVSLVSVDGTDAIVRLTSGEQSELNSMVLVEDKWIPTELALAWPVMMSTARAELDRLNTKSLAGSKSQLISRLHELEKTLDRLLAAKTQPEFDKLLTGLLVTVVEQ